ncbi:rRNA maturation RNase YbeY [Gracilimonas mengyeensis]|uniref:Endoribonuclease YbeY n=1 Tax=Gracilimonas mengyeensis TaxID=1302730 RepID=A0A521ATT6_9BACT|nr:rRNA maturation RNase YbeY [Gracilimonas mengyeensis]SMO38224.1 rRNA maturation RNase YbeY [Gracilimonas mengyeensis]
MSTQTPVIQLFNESNEEIPVTLKQAHGVLNQIADHEEVGFAMVELVYVDEEEIVRINKEHLERDYVTDIITFRYDEGEETGDDTAIEGTMFCCAPRIKEQAGEFNEPLEREFLRIIIHGLLHLAGYDDQSEKEKTHMTTLENKYLELAGNNK